MTDQTSSGQTPILLDPSKGRKVRGLIGFGIVAITLFTVFGTTMSHPFRPYEIATLLAFYTFPVTMVILRLLDQKLEVIAKMDIPYQKRGLGKDSPVLTYRIKKIYLVMAIVAVSTSLLVNACFLLNRYSDSSPAEYKTLSVINKSYTTHKSSKTYYVEIEKPDFVVPPFDFGLAEKIVVNDSEYAHIVLGQTQITLGVHQGALGFPWYESTHRLSGMSQSTMTQQAPASNSALIREACLWRAHFDAAREIENIPPQDFHRDFWAGGEPRSVEPLVNGQTHGIGHYTFANGKLYGDIPWKHGGKHGTFTLYREDGTRDQTLSYKDGHVFGINEWYLPNGEVKEAWLYLDDNKTLPVSTCDAYRGQ